MPALPGGALTQSLAIVTIRAASRLSASAVKTSSCPLLVFCVLVSFICAINSAPATVGTNTVSNTKDSGGGSLRQAMLDANASSNSVTVIQFSLSGHGVHTITPASLLPFLTRPVLIDGTSQSGYAGSPVVEINGSSAGSCNGFELRAGNSAIRGLIINRFAFAGIVLETNGNDQVQGCWIGTDSTGTNAAGNGSAGITVVMCSSNLIGGLTSSTRNVISANAAGVWLLGGASNQVQGNYIGLDATGLHGLGNQQDGVEFNALQGTTVYATDSVLGGTDPASRNFVSSNGRHGVYVWGGTLGPVRNQILGNYIGLNRDGTFGWINLGSGILISNATQITIGAPDAGNVISASGADGVGVWSSLSKSNVIQANFIGTGLLGTSFLANSNNGIHIVDSPYNTIGGPAPYTTIGGARSGSANVISGNGGNGIEIDGSMGNTVQGNMIGTDVTGQLLLANSKDGILLSTNPVTAQASSNNIIGGLATGNPAGASAANVIGGNGRNGIEIGPGASGNQILGNSIGMNGLGQTRVPNAWNGVALLDSTNNTIGGNSSGAGNIISGNISNGVLITTGPFGSGSRNNLVQGNFIGVSQTGNGASGVFVHGSSGNWIGGLESADKNFIAYNGSNLLFKGHGVVIESGTNNPVLGNNIYANAGRGIDLGNDSFDLPQFGNLTNGPNARQNYPVVTRTYFHPDGTHEITWTLTSARSRTFRIEVYRNSAPDPSGFGEGETFMYWTNVVTDANGVVVFTNMFLPNDLFFAATATDLLWLNTSEFSPVDTDGDGIPDAWETRGIDVNEDGVIDLTLTGADPYGKDIYVEIDTMAGRTPDMNHLFDVAIGRAPDYTDGFFTAPVNNPETDPGISLHMELDETNVPFAPWGSTNAWTLFQVIKTNFFGTSAQRNNPTNAANILAARRLVYHYCLFADTNPAAGGQGELGGNDFYVAVGADTTSSDSDGPTAAFMHELVHNLGLGHGGIDSLNYKPNYHSVMNYQWAYPGTTVSWTNWALDFSRDDFQTLNEANLDENVGVGGPLGHENILVRAGPWMTNGVAVAGTNLIVPEFGSIDWNGNGSDSEFSVARDIDFLSGTNGSLTNVLVSSQDWPRLRLYFLDNPQAAAALPPQETNDLSPTELAAFSALGKGWGVLQFSAPHYTIGETGTVAVITVTKVAELATNVSVSYATVPGGSAVPGTNYTTTSGTLNFGPTDTSQTFSVPILHDNVATGPLTVQLQLSNPTAGAHLGAVSRSTLTIADTDSPATFTVINTNDSGAGSLRQALLNVNATHGLALINFNITNSSLTMTPASALPTVTNAVTIDGTSQPGYSGTPKIELNGANAGGATDGLTLAGGSSVVRALVINRFGGNGLVLKTKGTNTVQGCYIGLNAAGTSRLANGGGISVLSGGNLIGGTTVGQGNFISGNNNRGIWFNALAATNNLVQGNVIGLGVNGAAVGNGAAGVTINFAGRNTIGGNAAGAANIISANTADGIEIYTPSNSIVGNLIGTTLTGTGTVGNGSNGVAFWASTAISNIVGGTRMGAGNVIGGNGRYGIAVYNASGTMIQRNHVGLDATGVIGLTNQLGGILLDAFAVGNQIGGSSATMANTISYNNGPGVFVRSDFASNNVIRANAIFANKQFGIALGQGGYANQSYNDPGDSDLGANGQQNYPVLTLASNSPGGTFISGTLNSMPNKNYILDFYANSVQEPSGYGQGQFWLGTTNITTDGTGNASFTAAVGWPQLPGPYIVATATDPAGNTSEFSALITATSSAAGRTFTVINTADSGSGSLRQAILDCNSYISAGNIISFNIPGAGVQTITPLSPLPPLVVPALIDGYSQPGASANTSTAADNAVLLVELNGSQVPNASGLVLAAGNSTIQGLVINRFGTNSVNFGGGTVIGGLELRGFGGNTVQGNFIGTDPTGMVGRGNFWQGIFINGSSNNLVGGTAPAQRNVISGNHYVIAPGTGVYNSGDAISIVGAGNTIQGNFIGVAADGRSALGNDGFGVRFTSGYNGNIPVGHTTIGGTVPGAGNIIAFNGSATYTFLGGGVDDPLYQCCGNAVLGNSIYSNILMGIQGDMVNSRNALGNFPFLSSALSSNGQAIIQGRLNGISNAIHRIEFFANDWLDPSGFGQGQRFLGSTNITTDTNGFASFAAVLPASITNGQYVSATATDNQNNTSEFSPRLKVGDVLTNVLVVNTSDDLDTGAATPGHTSLREAVFAANNHPGPDTIRFSIGSGVQFIQPSTSVPAIMDSGLTIDATSQPGYAGRPLIDYQSLGATVGFRLYSRSNTIRGFAIHDFQYGIYSSYQYSSIGVGGNVFEANYIGPNYSGTNNFSNQAYGLSLYYCPSNRIGGTTAAVRNIISDNNNIGLQIYGGGGNTIQGNYIGLDYTGTNKLPNGAFIDAVGGIVMGACDYNLIGGSTPGARNVIAGNYPHEFWAPDETSYDTIQGNFFGTDITGKRAFGSPDGTQLAGGFCLIQSNLIAEPFYLTMSNRFVGNLIGTDITGTNALGLGSVTAQWGNLIGGTDAASRNVFSGAGGILLEVGNIMQGNYVGLAADGVTPLGNFNDGVQIEGDGNIVGGLVPGAANIICCNGNNGIDVLSGVNNGLFHNSIYGNTNLGIALNNGIVTNDPGDFDTGPNNLQNFPILQSAYNTGAATLISGALNSISNTTFYIELFSNSACSPLGFGQGRGFLTSLTVTTDPSGYAPFSFNYPSPLPSGVVLTATASDLTNNTSEFSPCLTAVQDTNHVALSYNLAPPVLTLSWPTWAPSYVLQRATNLAPPVAWQIISNGITTNAGFKIYSVTNGPTLFFRLKSS
ncbi:MAG: hypothetical protein C5B50_09305 [Verrucomicrobia bacterium]|nr:MAG: hypothetical protein C5B50_09305 [Verrucomicrobiota bacterium]